MRGRTSLSHPLQIAEVRPAFGETVGGKIGLTFCPGKKQAHAVSGVWDRDLAIDLDVVSAWGAAAVVTLVEPHELESLQVAQLGDEVRARHMAWYHLPIRDVDVPHAAFEEAWARAGEHLRSLVRHGFGVLVHCKGGLGRAGTIAARLLVELGMDNATAIAQIRMVRPGAIETTAQLAHVRSCTPIEEPLPDTSLEAVRDRAVGALLGLAVGDALGTTGEFQARDSYPQITDLVGGGPFNLPVGAWTDDTAMALALAASLHEQGGLDEGDLMARFLAWRERGEYSCTGTCFDIGITVSQALSRFKRTGDPIAGATDPMSAGNGSLMRLSPVAIRYWQDDATRRDVAARQSRTTHGAAEAVDACVVFADLLAEAIAGKPRHEVMRLRQEPFAGRIPEVLAGSWRGRNRKTIRSSGYVIDSLEAALWCVARTGSFAEALLLAANLGVDADTVAAITGQLAGALYGKEGIPEHWLNRLAWSHQIETMALELTTPAGWYPR
ncbi:MAG: ADP-ribosylglycohydrolase family protein [Pseudomonadota bacterium]